MKWERVKVKHKVKEVMEGKKSPGRKGGTAGPGKKWGHTSNTVKNGRYLYVFGGYGKDDCQTQDVHVFDSVKQTWSKPNVKGLPPTPRDSHTCVTINNNLYVFGGTDGSSPLKDLHILDTGSNTWSMPQTWGEAPSAREGHSAALIGSRMYIFGGCGKSTDESDEQYFNDLYVFETKTMTWTKAATTGNHPAARDSHSMSSWNNKLIVLGGEDASNSFLSDIYILDADTFVWKELRTCGQKIIPRAGHTTVALRRHLFVFGGFTDDRKLFDDLHVLNVDTGVWTRAITTGTGPSPRFSLAGDVVDSERGILLFIGGCNENLEALDDMYYLDTEMKAEKPEVEPRREKLSLRKELKRKRQGGDLPSGQEDYSSPAGGGSVASKKWKLDIRKLISVQLQRISGQVGLSSLNRVGPTAGPSMYGVYDVVPVAERIFEAKISDVFHYGFTLEATIDNKPLRGLLFSYKPGFAHAAHNYVTRKKAAEEAALAKMREQRRTERRLARLAKAQAKRTEATASQSAQEPTPAVAPVPGLPADSAPPEQFQNYLQQMLGNAGSVAPPAEIPSQVPTVVPPTAAEAPEEPSPLPDMDTPATPPGVHQLAEEHLTEMDDE